MKEFWLIFVFLISGVSVATTGGWRSIPVGIAAFSVRFWSIFISRKAGF